jgi:hypothetical protein
MSDVEEGQGANGAGEDGGVLKNLPRARPQRTSARRIAERNGASARNASAQRPARRAPAPRRAAPKRERTAPVEEPAPRQGFECDGETPVGSVQPPGAAELVASAAELVGELAKAGVSTGERLLKDVLSRLPL